VKRIAFLAVVVAIALVGGISIVNADEGWKITSFDARYDVQQDGTMLVKETIHVDFGTQQHHGIFRYLYQSRSCGAPDPAAQQPLVPCPEGDDRVYDISSVRVTDLNGNPVKYSDSTSGDSKVLKIGDADKLVTGQQNYVISYQVKGALDAYSDHDELYWNAFQGWPVQAQQVQVELHLPDGAQLRATCFQGPIGPGNNNPCDSNVSGSTVTYRTTQVLEEDEGLTIVAGWQKGIAAVPAPTFHHAKTAGDFFTLDVIEWGGLAVVGLACIALLYLMWWRHGRDRRFKTLYYLTNDPSQQTKPLFAKTDVVVEFLPPDRLLPAQMGVILDERADTLDVTATIVDLAVRGYLHITEIPKHGILGKTDWTLTKKDQPAGGLQPYEQTLFDGLFESGDEVKMSDLKNTFVTRLNKVKSQLYGDAMAKKWFTHKPETSKGIWIGIGIAVLIIGAALTFASGWFLGRALIPLPIALSGLVLLVLAPSMSRRTAVGSEALRRVLGFRLYIATAETRRQEFNEQQNIFARYLPFAIVFGCVNKWAKAFEGLDDAAQQSTTSWYTSSVPFQVAAFSAGLQGFSSSVSSTISSSPSSSGGSGFSGGGFSGGGGGGGGGGSW
jgi:uncharacterized membrane protein YgcG